jgi:hypothetical protein
MSSSLSTRALGRRQIAVLVAAIFAFGGFAAWRTQAGAHAAEPSVDQHMTCKLAGALTVSYTVDRKPAEGVIAGKTLTLITKSAVQLSEGVANIGIKTMKITIPNPEGVGAAGSITATGGNLTKADQAVAGTATVLSMTAGAGVTAGTLEVPTLSIPFDIPESAAGKTISFPGPSSLELGVEVAGTALTETCTSDAGNPALLTIGPSGETTITEAPPTTAAAKGTDDTGEAGTAGAAKKPVAVKASPRFTG